MKTNKRIQHNTQGWQNLEMMRQLNGYLPNHLRLNVERIEELLLEIESLRGNSVAFHQINHFGTQLSAQVDPLLKGHGSQVILNIEPFESVGNRALDDICNDDDALTHWAQEGKSDVDVESEEWLLHVYHFHLDLIENYELIIKNYRPIIKDMHIIESFITKKVAQLMHLFPEAETMFQKMYGKRSESYQILKKELADLKLSLGVRA
jgi:hypothetical protein